MAALRLVKGRDAYQTVYTDLTGKQSKGILTIHGKCSRLNSRFLAGLVIIQDDLKAFTLRPSKIHSHEHFSPILRLGAAGSWMDGYDRVPCIVFAGEKSLSLELIHDSAQAIDLAAQFLLDLLPLAREVKISFDVLSASGKVVFIGERGLNAFALAHYLLRLLLV